MLAILVFISILNHLVSTEMDFEKILYIVHCIDTEGPLDEDLEATFGRLSNLFNISIEPTIENLRRIQNGEIDLSGKEAAVARCFSPRLLEYNRSWSDIDRMLSRVLDDSFRNQQLDDFGRGWIYSWHCLDHVGLDENPRRKDVGYGNIFRYYKNKLKETGSSNDEMNWHFHPLSLSRYPTHAATSYTNNYYWLNQILARRVLEERWFPVVNRPGFHAERPDSHSFLEQWVPFDYANQSGADALAQPDASFGRFGDWSRAPTTWAGYHPHHDDYQVVGSCRRMIVRCLNIGTRFRSLTKEHVAQAFSEANDEHRAVLAFANHDYRDISADVVTVLGYLRDVKKQFPDIKIKYAGAESAAVMASGFADKPNLELSVRIEDNRFFVEVVTGNIFGPQPYLAIRSKEGRYFHDNLDVIEPSRKWSYVLDDQTIQLRHISKIGAGSAGLYGGYYVSSIDLN